MATSEIYTLSLHDALPICHYGNCFDGLLEYEAGEFHVYCNVDRGNIPGGARARFTLAHELGHYFIDEHRIALIDRKSTRLNSSHSSISYAVFCLKKKK